MTRIATWAEFTCIACTKHAHDHLLRGCRPHRSCSAGDQNLVALENAKLESKVRTAGRRLAASIWPTVGP